MIPTDRFETGLKILGLIIVLTFPVTIGIPVLGFMIETLALLFIMLIAYKREYNHDYKYENDLLTVVAERHI